MRMDASDVAPPNAWEWSPVVSGWGSQGQQDGSAPVQYTDTLAGHVFAPSSTKYEDWTAHELRY